MLQYGHPISVNLVSQNGDTTIAYNEQLEKIINRLKDIDTVINNIDQSPDFNVDLGPLMALITEKSDQAQVLLDAGNVKLDALTGLVTNTNSVLATISPEIKDAITILGENLENKFDANIAALASGFGQTVQVLGQVEQNLVTELNELEVELKGIGNIASEISSKMALKTKKLIRREALIDLSQGPVMLTVPGGFLEMKGQPVTLQGNGAFSPNLDDNLSYTVTIDGSDAKYLINGAIEESFKSSGSTTYTYDERVFMFEQQDTAFHLSAEYFEETAPASLPYEVINDENPVENPNQDPSEGEPVEEGDPVESDPNDPGDPA